MDEDEEEEEEETAQLERQAGRATKRPKRNLFVEDEAEVDEDEEDEEEQDEEYDKGGLRLQYCFIEL